ncbi:cytochrome P450 [Actinocrispum sp. NPDC049592]|uniref:cytochrome P450 n=1 Tax=Actinocrispum sp. NPDC049592 TaxID=3154835 RepID=UPI003449B4AF
MTEIPLHVQRDGFDPVAGLVRLREERPVTPVQLPWGAKGWLVTRYDDVRQVLGDAARFRNAPGDDRPVLRPGQSARNGFLLHYDPPDHGTLRRMLTPEFTVRRIRRLQPRIEAIVADHLDAMEAGGNSADLVKAFALPIPSLVICELLGVPYADREEFQRNSSIRLNLARPMDERIAALEASHRYMAELVAEQRKDPGEDMIGMLVREHGDEIDDTELTGIADLLLIAGHETTSNMLALGTMTLLNHPDQADLVRSGEHVDDAVEELLRYLAIVHTVTPRTTAEEVVLSGQRIPAGEVLLCSLPAANRDPSVAEDPDTFDLFRKVSAHMAFGHGIHHCVGAPLARMEMRTAYPALLRRFPALRLAIPFEEVPFRSYSVVYGVESLPVTW